MNYPIPNTPDGIRALREQPVDEELIAAAIAGIIQIARAKGQSLEDLTNEVMADHRLLSPELRSTLRDIMSEAWDAFPSAEAS